MTIGVKRQTQPKPSKVGATEKIVQASGCLANRRVTLMVPEFTQLFAHRNFRIMGMSAGGFIWADPNSAIKKEWVCELVIGLSQLIDYEKTLGKGGFNE